MTETSPPRSRTSAVAEIIYYIVAAAFFLYLFQYYLTTTGGPTLLAFSMVPVTFILFTLDSLRRNQFYPQLGQAANIAIAGLYIAVCICVSVYLVVEFEEIGTVRAGIWNTTDLWLGGLMVVLVMEYARKQHFPLFVINIILILYSIYGWIVPGMFNHPGLSWTRIVTMTSLEDTTGVFSSLPQLALTLIGSFVLVLSVIRAFGCIDSILKGASQISAKSPYALPQAAVIGSMGVAAVSGSGAANAITTGSATIPALISAGVPRPNAASVETAASLGGQLMPPIMGISAFLMADFLDRSYFDVVARGYAPALVYFAGVSLGVYLVSVRYGRMKKVVAPEPMTWIDWFNLGAFALVVGGLVILMAVLHMPPMFAALYVFGTVGTVLMGRSIVVAVRAGGEGGLRELVASFLRFLDSFALMTADLTLLLATLSILTSAFVNTGVPPKVGFILVESAGLNLAVMVIVAFIFGALLGMGLPPAPTYILTALVIAPHMIKVGVNEWSVHFFAFFLAVWGELTPPTSVVAAVTAKIANASFIGTLVRAIELCVVLFVLMAAVFTRPAIVQEPGLSQIGAMLLVMVAAFGLIFSIQARFTERRTADYPVRCVLAAFALVVLFHPNATIATAACVPVVILILYWVWRRREIEKATPA